MSHAIIEDVCNYISSAAVYWSTKTRRKKHRFCSNCVLHYMVVLYMYMEENILDKLSN